MVSLATSVVLEGLNVNRHSEAGRGIPRVSGSWHANRLAEVDSCRSLFQGFLAEPRNDSRLPYTFGMTPTHVLASESNQPASLGSTNVEKCEAMLVIANDPDIQYELREINAEFAVAEDDGLNKY